LISIAIPVTPAGSPSFTKDPNIWNKFDLCTE
jgi:hypothetical protein